MKFTFATIFLFALIFNPGMNAEGRKIQKEDASAETRDFDVRSQYGYLTSYDVAWQALHVAAAAACRGSTPTGGSGTHVNAVLTRNTRGPKSCNQLCADSWATHCDAEVSIYGEVGKATTNGQTVGWFYNYDCNRVGPYGWGGEEAKAPEKEIAEFEEGAFSFCCCRK